MEHPWSSALVTGASSGIGAALARQLGAAGVSVVLVARRRERLDELAAEIAAGSGGSVEVLVADLTAADGRRLVASRLSDPDRPIDLLVNNAGVGAGGRFVDGDPDDYRQLIDLNVQALVELSHVAVTTMTERHRGWLMNISSLGGHTPGPGFAVYSATKAFVTSFSESLHEEVRRSGVVVTAVCPGLTHTEFGQQSAAGPDAGNDPPELLWQSADEVAAEGLRATAAGRAVRVTGTLNRITAAVTTVLPRSANRRLSAFVTDRM